HVEGAHAAVEERADDDVLRDEAAGAVLVQIVGAEAAAAAGELLHGRQWTGGDRHRLVLAPRVDDPDELRPVLGRLAHRLVADDEQALVEEGHDGVAEAGEGRLVVPAPEQARAGLVGDVEHQRAAVDVADVGAVRPPRIYVGVVRTVAGVEGRMARQRGLGVAVARAGQPPAADLARPRGLADVDDAVALVSRGLRGVKSDAPEAMCTYS